MAAHSAGLRSRATSPSSLAAALVSRAWPPIPTLPGARAATGLGPRTGSLRMPTQPGLAGVGTSGPQALSTQASTSHAILAPPPLERRAPPLDLGYVLPPDAVFDLSGRWAMDGWPSAAAVLPAEPLLGGGARPGSLPSLPALGGAAPMAHDKRVRPRAPRRGGRAIGVRGYGQLRGVHLA
jgi:hypothetical protein